MEKNAHSSVRFSHTLPDGRTEGRKDGTTELRSYGATELRNYGTTEDGTTELRNYGTTADFRSSEAKRHSMTTYMKGAPAAHRWRLSSPAVFGKDAGR